MIRILYMLSEVPFSVEVSAVAERIARGEPETLDLVRTLAAARLVNHHEETGLCTGLYDVKDIPARRLIATDAELYGACEKAGLLTLVEDLSVDDLMKEETAGYDPAVRMAVAQLKKLIKRN